jgi:hypothetical protein
MFSLLNDVFYYDVEKEGWMKHASLVTMSEIIIGQNRKLFDIINDTYTLKRNLFLQYRFGVAKHHPLRLKINNDVVIGERDVRIHGMFTIPDTTKYNTVDPTIDDVILSNKIESTLKSLGVEQTKSPVFKILDLQKRGEVKLTTAGAVSEKGRLSGKACTSYKAGEHEDFHARLVYLLENDPALKTAYSGLVIKYPKHLGQSSTACSTLEYLLQILDYLQVRDRRWFLNIFETVYYRKPK